MKTKVEKGFKEMKLEKQGAKTEMKEALATPDDGYDLLTIDDLAEIFKVPKSWIYAHTRPDADPRLPSLKVGKYLRFRESEVLEFINDLRNSRNA